MRAAVVGHVEWVDFLRVDHAPAPGEIVHTLDAFEEPAGGGAVAADPAAVRAARRGRVLVATSRMLDVLRPAHVELDALVGSAVDPSEAYADGDLDPAPRLVVRTAGAAGGECRADRGRWTPFEA